MRAGTLICPPGHTSLSAAIPSVPGLFHRFWKGALNRRGRDCIREVGEIRFWFIGFRVIGEVQWSVAYYNVQAIGWKGRVLGVPGVLGFLEFLGGVGFGGGESGFVCRILRCEFRGGGGYGEYGGGEIGFVYEILGFQFCGGGGGSGGCLGNGVGVE